MLITCSGGGISTLHLSHLKPAPGPHCTMSGSYAYVYIP